VSRVLATNRPGRPYKAKVSHIGNRKRRRTSKPDTAGGVSGMMKTNPSVDDTGSVWIVMLPSTFKSVDESINSFACG
jgi:hypothetical protein